MSKYFTCEADLNFPIPSSAMLAQRVKVMYDEGHKAITAKEIASFYCLSESAIICAMRRLENNRMIRRVSERAWVPIITS